MLSLPPLEIRRGARDARFRLFHARGRRVGGGPRGKHRRLGLGNFRFGLRQKRLPLLDPVLQFGNPERDERLPFLHGVANVDGHLVYVAGDLGVKRRFFIRLDAGWLRCDQDERLANWSTDDDDVRRLCEAFNEAYARQYSPEAAFPQAGIDIEEFHLKVWVPADREPAVKHELTPGDGRGARTGERPVYWGPAGTVSTDVFDRSRLVPGDAFTGPAIVESDDTTTVVPIGWHYRIDEYGNGVMERGFHTGAEGAGR